MLNQYKANQAKLNSGAILESVAPTPSEKTADTGSFLYGIPLVIYNTDSYDNIDTGTFNYGLPLAIFATTPSSSPIITYISPTSVRRGFQHKIAIYGTEFLSGCLVEFSGDGIRVLSTEYQTSGWTIATIDVLPTATLNKRDVIIKNPDSGNYTFSQALSIVDFNIEVFTRTDTLDKWQVLHYDKDFNFLQDVSKYIYDITVNYMINNRRRERKLNINLTQPIPKYENTWFKVVQTVTDSGVEKVIDHGWYILISPTINETIAGKTTTNLGYDQTWFLKKKVLKDDYVIVANSDIEFATKQILEKFSITPYALPFLNETFTNELSYNAKTSVEKLLEGIAEYFDGEYWFNNENVFYMNPIKPGFYWGNVGRITDSKTSNFKIDIDDTNYYNSVVLDWGNIREGRSRTESKNIYELQKSIFKEVVEFITNESITDENTANETIAKLLADGTNKKERFQMTGRYWEMKIRDLLEYEKKVYIITALTFSRNKDLQVSGELYNE